MIKRCLLLLSFVTLAAASNFHIDLYQPTIVNGTTLKPGEARLELKENKAVLKQGKTTVEAPVKVENAREKFPYTTVGYKEANHQIKDICLAGTTTRLVFE